MIASSGSIKPVMKLLTLYMLWYLLLFFSKHLVKTALEIELKSQDTFKSKRAVALIILNFANCKQFNRLTQALLDYKVEFNFRNFSLTFCLHWMKSGRGSTLWALTVGSYFIGFSKMINIQQWNAQRKL